VNTIKINAGLVLLFASAVFLPPAQTPAADSLAADNELNLSDAQWKLIAPLIPPEEPV